MFFVKGISPRLLRESWILDITDLASLSPAGKPGGGAQCVELKLRWRFCAHTGTCPDIYFE